MGRNEDFERLLKPLLPYAKKVIADSGGLVPFGAVIERSGTISNFGAFDDQKPSPQALYESLKNSFRELAQKKQVTATAILFDVKIVPPGATEKSDAVAARLDHEGGSSVIVMTPYRTKAPGQVEFGRAFTIKGPADIFPPASAP